MEWTSIEFLHFWHPGRPWMLTAINPHKKGIETRAFLPGQEAEAEAWVTKHNGVWGVYFSPASVIEPENKKAEIKNIAEVFNLHTDLDLGEPPDDCEDPQAWVEAELPKLKRRLFEDRPEQIPEPSLVIYSGGGYHAYWLLEEPIQVRGNADVAKLVASYNKWLEKGLGGDSCSNVDRIMRLPGTLNVPGPRKIAKGRTEQKAEPVYQSDVRYTLEDFQQWVEPIPATSVAVRVPETVKPLRSVDDLDEWNVTDRTKVICVLGHDPDAPDRHPSRSEWLFDAVCNLVRCEVPDEMIYSVLTDTQKLHDYGTGAQTDTLRFQIAESVLEQSDPDRYARKQIKSAKEVAIAPELHEINSKYFVLGNVGGRCVVAQEVYDEAMKRHRLVKQSFTDFRNYYLNRSVPVGEGKTEPLGHWWLKHPNRRQYRNLVFLPGRGELPESYNLWQGFGVKAVPGDRHQSFLDHTRDIICSGNEEHFEYLMNWLARMVQHPEMSGSVAIVLQGDKGIGKSIWAKALGVLMGRHFLHVSNAEHVVGRFNGHLRDAVLVFGDEAFFAGDKRHESVLKTLITEDTLVVEIKGVDAEPSPNFVHLILASNHKWVIPATTNERRYFVPTISEKYLLGDDATQEQKDEKDAYFKQLLADLENGGYQALLAELQARDISEFNVFDVPRSEGLAAQIGEGDKRRKPWLDVLAVWLRDAAPCDGYDVGEEGRSYPCVALADDLHGITRQRLWTELQALGVRKVQGTTREDRSFRYVFPGGLSLPEVRGRFLARYPYLRETAEQGAIDHWPDEDIPF